jgi:hypothetical protein
MRNNSTYRTLSALLAAMFALFSIGLPVVLDSCPMPKMSGSMTCFPCHQLPVPAGDTPVLQSPRCCTPVIVGERNTTAFVQSQRPANESRAVALDVLAPVPMELRVSALRNIQSFNPSWSPPGRDADLPVLHSSLLI